VFHTINLATNCLSLQWNLENVNERLSLHAALSSPQRGLNMQTLIILLFCADAMLNVELLIGDLIQRREMLISVDTSSV